MKKFLFVLFLLVVGAYGLSTIIDEPKTEPMGFVTLVSIQEGVVLSQTMITVKEIDACSVVFGEVDQKSVTISFASPVTFMKDPDGCWYGEVSPENGVTFTPKTTEDCTEFILSSSSTYDTELLKDTFLSSFGNFEGTFTVTEQKIYTPGRFFICGITINDIQVATGGYLVVPQGEVIIDTITGQITGVFTVEPSPAISCRNETDGETSNTENLLQVHVTDIHGDDISGSEVMLYLGGQPPLTAVTDSNGMAFFYDLGNFNLAEIKVSRSGFGDYSVNISQESLDGFPVPVQLKPLDN